MFQGVIYKNINRKKAKMAPMNLDGVLVKLWEIEFHQLERDLIILKEHSQFLEQFLEDKIDKFKNTVDKEAASLSEEEKEEFFEWKSEDYSEIAEDVPNLLRGSLFVTEMSLLESWFIYSCRISHKISKEALSLSDIKGDIISRAQIYLKKVIKISFPDDTISWEKICLYQKIRNSIVHKRGEVDEDEAKQINNFICAKKLNCLELKHKRIFLKENFCLEVLDTIDEFTSLLDKALDTKLKLSLKSV